MKTMQHLVLAIGLAPAFLAAPAFAASDAPFLAEAMKGDNSEVALGALAQKRGATAQTRQFGTMLVHDHGAHRLKLARLDRAMGLRPTTDLSDEGAQAKTMLLGLHGAAFDAAFKHHMIEDHRQDIAKYETEAHAAGSAQVRQMAQDTLPTLHKHLDAANAL